MAEANFDEIKRKLQSDFALQSGGKISNIVDQVENLDPATRSSLISVLRANRENQVGIASNIELDPEAAKLQEMIFSAMQDDRVLKIFSYLAGDILIEPTIADFTNIPESTINEIDHILDACHALEETKQEISLNHLDLSSLTAPEKVSESHAQNTLDVTDHNNGRTH